MSRFCSTSDASDSSRYPTRLTRTIASRTMMDPFVWIAESWLLVRHGYQCRTAPSGLGASFALFVDFLARDEIVDLPLQSDDLLRERDGFAHVDWAPVVERLSD